MTAGSKPSISSLAVRPVAHRLNGLDVKALKALAIMFLLQPASCGNLRSEGLADEWYESKDFHCGEFEPNSLLEVLRPEEMQKLGVENYIPCVHQKLDKVRNYFDAQDFLELKKRCDSAHMDCHTNPLDLYSDAINYIFKANHSSVNPYDSKMQKNVSLMGLILRIPQNFKIELGLSSYTNELKFKFFNDWLHLVQRAALFCSVVGGHTYYNNYRLSEHESRLITIENGDKQLQTLSELLLLSLELIPKGMFDRHCTQKIGCKDFITRIDEEEQYFLRTIANILKARLKCKGISMGPCTYVTRSELRQTLGADSIEEVGGEVIDSEIQMLSRFYKNPIVEANVFYIYSEQMPINPQLIKNMAKVLQGKHVCLSNDLEQIQTNYSAVRDKAKGPKLRGSTLGVEINDAKKKVKSLIFRAETYKKSAEKVAQSHQIQAGIVNSTNHAHSDIISKMTEFMLQANKVHDEL